MASYRHAIDRTDWTLVTECPNNGTDHPLLGDDPEKVHLPLKAHATNAAKTAGETSPVEGTDCPVCGAEVEVVIDKRPTEVLR